MKKQRYSDGATRIAWVEERDGKFFMMASVDGQAAKSYGFYGEREKAAVWAAKENGKQAEFVMTWAAFKKGASAADLKDTEDRDE